MPEGIDKSDWDEVRQMACYIVNAALMEDDVLLASRNSAMLDLLASLQEKYGDHPSILATIGDYLDDPTERRTQYMKALAIARAQRNQPEIEEITDSLRSLEEEDSQQPPGRDK